MAELNKARILMPVPHFPHSEPDVFSVRIGFGGWSASGFGQNCELWMDAFIGWNPAYQNPII